MPRCELRWTEPFGFSQNEHKQIRRTDGNKPVRSVNRAAHSLPRPENSDKGSLQGHLLRFLGVGVIFDCGTAVKRSLQKTPDPITDAKAVRALGKRHEGLLSQESDQRWSLPERKCSTSSA